MNENEAERLFEIRQEEKKNMKDLKSLGSRSRCRPAFLLSSRECLGLVGAPRTCLTPIFEGKTI